MKHLFLPYNLALLAKEKGFDELCLGLYIENEFLLYSHYAGFDEPMNFNVEKLVSAPLYQQISDWFREKHNIDVHVAWDGLSNHKNYYCVWLNGSNMHNEEYDYYTTLNKAIEEAFKLI